MAVGQGGSFGRQPERLARVACGAGQPDWRDTHRAAASLRIVDWPAHRALPAGAEGAQAGIAGGAPCTHFRLVNKPAGCAFARGSGAEALRLEPI